jgi:hypothetical protein
MKLLDRSAPEPPSLIANLEEHAQIGATLIGEV